MTRPRPTPTGVPPRHPAFTRRFALQAGAVGLLGLGIDHLAALRAAGSPPRITASTARSVIFIFLSGGLAQHESFDPKPDAPEGIRGEFRPIATRTPGVHVCEHLPLLAAAQPPLVDGPLADPRRQRPLGGPPRHAHRAGRTCPPASTPTSPNPTDWPSIAAVAGATCEAEEQPAPGGGPARAAGPQHRAGHPRPVRRDDGAEARPLVRRGVPVRPGRLRGLPRVRVRPPGPPEDAQAAAVPGPRPDAARGARRPPAHGPAGPPRPPRPPACRPGPGRPTSGGSTPGGRRPSRC